MCADRTLVTDPKISGRYVEAILESFGEVSPIFEKKGREIFQSIGIREVDPDEWYEMQKVVRATHVIENEVGEQSSEQAGVKQVEYTDAFDGFDSFAEAIEAGNRLLEQVYEGYSREEVGAFVVESLADDRYRVSVTGPYPYADQFVKGILIGLAQEGTGSSPRSVSAAEERADESHAYVFEY